MACANPSTAPPNGQTNYMIGIAQSVNGIPIRLSDERWAHILAGHPEMQLFLGDLFQTIQTPEVVYQGKEGALIAAVHSLNANKHVVVVYKEVSETDGFVITAFLTSNLSYLKNKTVLWAK